MAYAAAGNAGRGWQEMLVALRTIGEPFPKSTIRRVGSYLWTWMKAVLLLRTGWRFGKAKPAERAFRKRLYDMYNDGALMCFFDGNILDMALLVVRGLHNAHYLGATVELPKAMIWYCFMLGGGFPNVKKIAQYHARAQALAEQLGDPETSAWIGTMCTPAYDMAGDFTTARRLAAEYEAPMIKHLGAFNLLGVLMSGVLSHVLQGNSRESLELADHYLPLMERRQGVVPMITIYGARSIHRTSFSASGRRPSPPRTNYIACSSFIRRQFKNGGPGPLASSI